MSVLQAPPRPGGRGARLGAAVDAWPVRRAAWTVGALAALLRVLGPLIGSGLTSDLRYDASVYYTAGAALIHGRLPYRDFILVHPPLIAYATAPFALLGHLTTDRTGFVVATLAFIAIGGLNAGLVVRLAHRWGLPARAALVGGLAYAVSFPSIGAEYLVRLEPLGNLLLLLALHALSVPRETTRRRAVGAGLAFGALVSLKVWWVVPIAVVVAWAVTKAARPERGRLLARIVAGAVVAGLVIDGVPFVADPAGMWRMVVTAQLGRPRGLPFDGRLAQLMGVAQAWSDSSHLVSLLVALLLLAVLVGALRVAVRVPQGRLVVWILVAQLAVLIQSPPWYSAYADYATVPLALALACAASARSEARVPAAYGFVAATALLCAAAMVATAPRFTVPVPHADAMARAAAPYPCVTSGSPMALIELDALDRSFGGGCPNWVDVLALGFDVRPSRLGGVPPRPDWNRQLGAYLLAGDAVVRYPRPLGLPPWLRLRIVELPTVARDRDFTVQATRPRPGSRPVPATGRP